MDWPLSGYEIRFRYARFFSDSVRGSLRLHVEDPWMLDGEDRWITLDGNRQNRPAVAPAWRGEGGPPEAAGASPRGKRDQAPIRSQIALVAAAPFSV